VNKSNKRNNKHSGDYDHEPSIVDNHDKSDGAPQAEPQDIRAKPMDIYGTLDYKLEEHIVSRVNNS